MGTLRRAGIIGPFVCCRPPRPEHPYYIVGKKLHPVVNIPLMMEPWQQKWANAICEIMNEAWKQEEQEEQEEQKQPTNEDK